MEASINIRVFKMMLLVLGLVAINAEANPLLHISTRDRDSRPERNEMPTPDPKKDVITDHYDQRQNGTENYRVKVDGLVFILAPADTLLLAGAALEPNFSSMIPSHHSNKPQPKPEKDKEEPSKGKPDIEDIPKSAQHDPAHPGHKPMLRISNLIAPFLNRIRHTQQSTK